MKKHFTPTKRVLDIISMAFLYQKFFTTKEIMEDYEIKEEVAYRTLKTIKEFEILKVERNSKNGKYIITPNPKFF